MIDKIRKSCQLAADTLLMVGENICEGMTTEVINTLVHEYILSRNAYPSPLHYRGFPKSVCTSVNECICHGIPNNKQTLKNGDIVNVDVTCYLPKINGAHGDTSAMFFIGQPSEEARLVVETARRCLEIGIAEVKPGARLGNIGAAIQQYAENQGCSVVRDFVGHGIGAEFHMPPSVYHWGTRGTGPKIKEGMVFTIEPMINIGAPQYDIMKDSWTVLTRDRKLSAQFEHTVLVKKDCAEILTKRNVILKNSENVV